VARTAAYELERRVQTVVNVAESKTFRRQLAEMFAKPDVRRLLAVLSDPKRNSADTEPQRNELRDNPDRLALQKEFESLIPPTKSASDGEFVASWFFCEAHGVSMLRTPEGRTTGLNFAWRSFFHRRGHDMDEMWRPGPDEHITEATLSTVFQSQATSRWVVAISAPVFDDSPQRKFLGVVAMTAEVGRFIVFSGDENQFAVLIDNREGKHRGLVLQHPLLDKLAAEQGRVPYRFKDCRVPANVLEDRNLAEHPYRDPVTAFPEGAAYNRVWLAQMEPVRFRGRDTGWVVIVQEAYDTAIGGTMDELKRDLVRSGLIALGLISLVMAAMWWMAKRMSTS
jgi:eukaryotic-like serine/threonine-protein kinase